MATGKKALDIFTPTTGRKADIEKEVPERIVGRPRAAEPYKKVTVILYDSQILFLDKLSLAIREKTGQVVHRAELIRALVDGSAGQWGYADSTWNPVNRKDFDQKVRELFPILS